MKIVPFEPGHLGDIDPGPFEMLAIEGLDPDVLKGGHPMPGPAVTYLDDHGRPIGATGIVPLWRGVGQAWVFASDHLRAHPVALHRGVSRSLALAEAHLGFHRVQITVHEKFHTSMRWVERLGFYFEGAMPGYGPNKDTYMRYARLKNVRN